MGFHRQRTAGRTRSGGAECTQWSVHWSPLPSLPQFGCSLRRCGWTQAPLPLLPGQQRLRAPSVQLRATRSFRLLSWRTSRLLAAAARPAPRRRKRDRNLGAAALIFQASAVSITAAVDLPPTDVLSRSPRRIALSLSPKLPASYFTRKHPSHLSHRLLFTQSLVACATPTPKPSAAYHLRAPVQQHPGPAVSSPLAPRTTRVVTDCRYTHPSTSRRVPPANQRAPDRQEAQPRSVAPPSRAPSILPAKSSAHPPPAILRRPADPLAAWEQRHIPATCASACSLQSIDLLDASCDNGAQGATSVYDCQRSEQ